MTESEESLIIFCVFWTKQKDVQHFGVLLIGYKHYKHMFACGCLNACVHEIQICCMCVQVCLSVFVGGWNEAEYHDFIMAKQKQY